MKIEKVSDTQLKIIVSRADLNERNIDLIELLNGSDKTHGLLRDMMEQALVEYDFQINNSPIVIEVSPLSLDSLMLIVTKMDAAQSETSLGGQDHGLAEGLSLSNSINLLSELAKLTYHKKRPSSAKARPVRKREDVSAVFSFERLDDVINASVRLYDIFDGESLLVKKGGKYFLIINNTQQENRPSINTLGSILCEYGQKHPVTNLSEHYLKEHGDVLIERRATVKLALYL